MPRSLLPVPPVELVSWRRWLGGPQSAFQSQPHWQQTLERPPLQALSPHMSALWIWEVKDGLRDHFNPEAEVRRPPAGVPALLPYAKLSAWSDTLHGATQPGCTCPGTPARLPRSSRPKQPGWSCWAGRRGGLIQRPDEGQGCPPLMGLQTDPFPPGSLASESWLSLSRERWRQRQGVGRRGPWIAPRSSSSLFS